MADAREGLPKPESPVIEKLQRRVIFVSHTHSDRKLAAELQTLVQGAFSGLVDAFVSSDPAPTGGLQPGDEWYPKIHTQLLAAVSVWVLATPRSIQRPWIYWEAGIGKATCPGAVVVLRVGLSNEELPSPLNSFQSYDGLEAGEQGVGELIGKVAHQIGMKLTPVLIDSVSEKWVSEAKDHEPEAEDEAPSPKLSPEQLGQFGALIARLESLVLAASSPPLAAAPRSRRRVSSTQQRLDAERTQIIGRATAIYRSVSDLVRAVDKVVPETKFRFEEIDEDGDAEIEAEREGETTTVWLQGSVLEDCEELSEGSAAARSLISDILRGYREHEEE